MIEHSSDGHVLSFIVLGRTDLDGDSRGYRSAEEQARELTRSIRREVGKLSDKWNALIDRSDQWRRRLDETLAVSLFIFVNKKFLYSNFLKHFHFLIITKDTYNKQKKVI